MQFSSEDKRRYSRQIAIEEIGESGQMKICSSSVFIVGCGALGSMVAMQLAGAGIGRIGLADYDTIDISNLQRQFFFSTSEAGMAKTRVLESRILALNPQCDVKVYAGMINKEKSLEIFPDYDFIVDATDNPASKFMVEEVSGMLSKPCSVAGVLGFRGQVMTILPGGNRFSDLFPDSEESGFMPCSIGGVIGPSASVCASLQAAEVIKYLTGVGEVLNSSVLVFDLLSNSFSCYRL